MDVKLPLEKLIVLEESDPMMRKMMVTGENLSYLIPGPLNIVRIYAQKYKSKTYDFDMWNQHCMFLLTKPNLLKDQILNGVQMGGSEFPFFLGKGAYMTDNFNYAATLMKEDDNNERAFVPVVGVGLGNVKACINQEAIDQYGVPKAYDSIWLRGVYGHHSYNYLPFAHRKYKVHVGGFSVMRDRMHPLRNSIYFVDKPKQVDILFVVDVEWNYLTKEQQYPIKKENYEMLNY